MIDRFKSHFSSNYYYLFGKKVLVASSGGVDSQVLIDLLIRINLTPDVAHVDHNTREGESQIDAEFVEQFCLENSLVFHSGDFTFDGKGNFQNEARTFRYAFFDSLDYDYILTAHHRDDNTETILINTLNGRSTKGIPPISGNVIRPLLPFGKSHIRQYADEHDIAHIEDSSNADSNYQRNLLRNEVIPIVSKSFDNLPARLENLSARDTYKNEFIDHLLKSNGLQAGADKEIPWALIEQYSGFEALVLYHILEPFGYSLKQLQSLNYDTLSSGAEISSTDYSTIISHGILHTTPKSKLNNGYIKFKLEDGHRLSYMDREIIIDVIPSSEMQHNLPNQAFFAIELLDQDVTLRQWRKGDATQGIGMNGRSKSLKKIWNENKFHIHKKMQTPILEYRNQILWIVGVKRAMHYLVDDQDNNCIRVNIS